MRRGVLSCCLVLVWATASPEAGQTASVFDALTVPAGALPAGCVVTPSPSERVGSRLIGGLWAGLPVRSNPWTGETPRVLVELRIRMFGPSRMPDGPPDARIAAQLERDLVAGMTGYAAFYHQGDARVAVYALRGVDVQPWPRSSLVEPEAEAEAGPAVARFRSGSLSALAAGDRGPCFAAVERHLHAAVETAAL